MKRCSVEAICESSHLKFAHLCNATGHPRHETPRNRCRAQFLHIELHGIREKHGKVSRSQLFFNFCIQKGLLNEIQGRLISLQSLPKVSPSTSSIQIVSCNEIMTDTSKLTNIYDVQHIHIKYIHHIYIYIYSCMHQTYKNHVSDVSIPIESAQPVGLCLSWLLRPTLWHPAYVVEAILHERLRPLSPYEQWQRE